MRRRASQEERGAWGEMGELGLALLLCVLLALAMMGLRYP